MVRTKIVHISVTIELLRHAGLMEGRVQGALLRIVVTMKLAVRCASLYIRGFALGSLVGSSLGTGLILGLLKVGHFSLVFVQCMLA